MILPLALAYSLPICALMNLIDVFIIYLACGAPVGVYFYLQNRRRLFSKQLWLKTILNFVFWIPLFVQIVQRSTWTKNLFSTKPEFSRDSSKILAQLASAQKRLEKIIFAERISLSIYEFREVFERFVGLSVACLDSVQTPAAHEKEIFLIDGGKSAETAARCFHRRNLKRLSFHQIEAEKDFLQLISFVCDTLDDFSEIRDLTIEISETLQNSKLQTAFDKMFAERRQTRCKNAVRELERDLWNSEAHKQQPARPISMNLPAVSLKTNSFSND